MKFPPGDTDRKATILLNYTGRSLHSALQEGVKNTWPADFSTIKQFPWTPANINTDCFVKGFNLIARTLSQLNMTIKSRIGVQSQPPKCAKPYWVRGAGIGYHHPLIPEISCGEITISPQNPKPKTHQAFCRIYIQ